MPSVPELCRLRIVEPIGINTPLLVPSFSSRTGATALPRMVDICRPYVRRVSLISAYDISNGHFQKADFYASDVVFIDSGGYESRPILDLEAVENTRTVRPWSLETYHGVIRQLEPLAQFVIVNFDLEDGVPIEDQLRSAQELFVCYPHASDFLVKPETREDAAVRLEGLKPYLSDLKRFSVLGVTEKELGRSLVERCMNLANLRVLFNQAGTDLPIHVFGCLDPHLMVLYFLLGADVFDGLTWLRFAFRGGVPTYHRINAFLDEAEWVINDEEVFARHWIANLDFLTTLETAMREFVRSWSLSVFEGLLESTQMIASLLRRLDVAGGLM